MRNILLRLLLVIALSVVGSGVSVLVFISTFLQPSRDEAIAALVAAARADGYVFADARRYIGPALSPPLALGQARVVGRGMARELVYDNAGALDAVALAGVRHVPDLWLRFDALPLPHTAAAKALVRLRRVPRASLPADVEARLPPPGAPPRAVGVENLPGSGDVALISDAPDDTHVWVLRENSGRANLLRWVVLLLSLAFLSAGSYFVLRPLLVDLRTLHETSRKLGAGDLDARAELSGSGPTADVGRAFDHMAQRLSRQVRSRETLLRAVAHEIRNPLARIVFAEASLRKTSLDESQRGHIDVVARAASQIENFAREVLELVRLNVNIESDEVHVRTSDVHAMLIAQSDGPEHPGVTWDGDERVVAASPIVVRRVTQNLLDNARKYGGDGVVVTLSATPDGFQIEIEDDGDGIAVGERENVFEPFIRLGDASPDQGLGLGLTLVHELVAQSGGTVVITAPRHFAQGVRFVVTLPWAKADAPGGRANL